MTLSLFDKDSAKLYTAEMILSYGLHHEHKKGLQL